MCFVAVGNNVNLYPDITFLAHFGTNEEMHICLDKYNDTKTTSLFISGADLKPFSLVHQFQYQLHVVFSVYFSHITQTEVSVWFSF